MTAKIHYLSRAIALLSLIGAISSCAKHNDVEPSTQAQGITPAYIQHAKSEYNQLGSSAILVNILGDKMYGPNTSWVPKWENSFLVGKSLYTPVLFSNSKNPDPARAKGTFRYLVKNQAAIGFSVKTYIFKDEPETWSSEQELLAGFTGLLLWQEAGKKAAYHYERGIKKEASNSIKKTAGSNKIASCLTTYSVCTWEGQCITPDRIQTVYVTVEGTGNGCESPSQEVCFDDWGATWHSVYSSTYTVNCDGTPEDPATSESFFNGKFILQDASDYPADMRRTLSADNYGSNPTVTAPSTQDVINNLWELFPQFGQRQVGGKSVYVYSVRKAIFFQGTTTRSGQSLDVQGGSTSANTPVIVANFNRNWSQQWLIEPSGWINDPDALGGITYTYYITNANTMLSVGRDANGNVIATDDPTRKINWLLGFVQGIM